MGTQQTTPETALDEFTTAYILAALWTFDDDAPSGEYETSGRFQILFPKIDQQTVLKMAEDCATFQKENREILAAFQPCDSQNGHDFWLTRNHHGSGFWDRDQNSEDKFKQLADLLTQASNAFGEFNLYYGDDGKIYS